MWISRVNRVYFAPATTESICQGRLNSCWAFEFFGLDGVIKKHDDLGESVRSETNSVLSGNMFMNLKPAVYRTPDMNIS